jgi:hypothetical protein
MASGIGRHHRSKETALPRSVSSKQNTYDLVIIDMLMPGEGEPDASNPDHAETL